MEDLIQQYLQFSNSTKYLNLLLLRLQRLHIVSNLVLLNPFAISIHIFTTYIFLYRQLLTTYLLYVFTYVKFHIDIIDFGYSVHSQCDSHFYGLTPQGWWHHILVVIFVNIFKNIPNWSLICTTYSDKTKKAPYK